jgi:hypothetical protein
MPQFDGPSCGVHVGALAPGGRLHSLFALQVTVGNGGGAMGAQWTTVPPGAVAVAGGEVVVAGGVVVVVFVGVGVEVVVGAASARATSSTAASVSSESGSTRAPQATSATIGANTRVSARPVKRILASA